MHFLPAVAFTQVCLWLAFICWKGPHYNAVISNEINKRKLQANKVKLTAMQVNSAFAYSVSFQQSAFCH